MDTPLIDQVLRARGRRHRRRLLLAFAAGCALTWFVKDPVLEKWDTAKPQKYDAFSPPVAASSGSKDVSELTVLERIIGNIRANVRRPHSNQQVPHPNLKPRIADDCWVSDRPYNGAIVSGEENGNHLLKIDNQTERDALIKVKDGENNDALIFYVRSNSSSTRRLPDGVYSIYFGHGTMFSADCMKFLHNFDRYRFPGTTSLATRATATEIITSELSFTLHTVANGNISRQTVSADEW